MLLNGKLGTSLMFDLSSSITALSKNPKMILALSENPKMLVTYRQDKFEGVITEDFSMRHWEKDALLDLNQLFFKKTAAFYGDMLDFLLGGDDPYERVLAVQLSIWKSAPSSLTLAYIKRTHKNMYFYKNSSKYSPKVEISYLNSGINQRCSLLKNSQLAQCSITGFQKKKKHKREFLEGNVFIIEKRNS